MFKLVLEKAEEPEIKLPISAGSSKKQEGSALNIHWKDWWRSWNSNTLATWCQEPTPWKSPWFWKRLRAGGEGDDRGWDGWMASLTQWIWVWARSGSRWWTGKLGVLPSMGHKELDTMRDWTDFDLQKLFVSNLLFNYLPFFPLEVVSSHWASRNMYPNEIQFIFKVPCIISRPFRFKTYMWFFCSGRMIKVFSLVTSFILGLIEH